jgi:hypothetical protein
MLVNHVRRAMERAARWRDQSPAEVAMVTKNMYPRRGAFGNYYIGNLRHGDEGWTGATWAKCARGLSCAGVQICNFASNEEAEDYILQLRGVTLAAKKNPPRIEAGA